MKQKTQEKIKINGSKKFRRQTAEAFLLLKRKAPSIYENIVLKYIKKIGPAKTSGMNVFGKEPTYEVGAKTAFQSLKWYATTIAHDAYHSKLYFDYKKKHEGKKVPKKIYNSPAAELKCIKIQIKTAEQIGASKVDIEYLKSLDGSHSKLSEVDW